MSETKAQRNKKNRSLKSGGLSISMLDLLTLYVNLYKCKNDEEIGYMDYGKPLSELHKRLTAQRIYVSTKELEGLLWACQQQDEASTFWDSGKRSLKAFLKGILNYKQTEMHFHKIYSWVYKGKGHEQ